MMTQHRATQASEPGDIDDSAKESATFDSRATGRLAALNINHSRAAETVTDHKKFNRRLVIGYLALSVAWILLSDAAVEAWIATAEMRAQVQTIKGIVFVSLSTGFLFFLLTRHFARIRQVERQIQDRDSHIGRIIDTMANGVALIDLDGTIVDVNPILAEILGKRRGDLIGRPLSPVHNAQGEGASTSLILEYAREHGQWSGELESVQTDRRSIPVHLTLAPLYDDNQYLTGYVGVYLDLREIQAARAHVDGLGSVIEQLATETDLELVGEMAVSAAVELTGGDLGGVILLDDDRGHLHHRWQSGFSDDVDTVDHSRSGDESDTALVARVLEDGTPRFLNDADAISRRLSSYGDQGIHNLAAVPIDVRGITRGALIVGINDSAQTLDEDQLPLLQAVARQLGVAIHRHELLKDARRSEARFRNVVNTVPDILFSASLPEFETRFISPSVERILGAPREEFLANPQLWRELIHDDDLAELWPSLLPGDESTSSTSGIAAESDDSGRYNVEYRIWNYDRTRYFWFEDRGKIDCDEEGNPAAITSVVSDITARKKAEDRLAFLAFHDRLTGLPNRLGLLQELDHWCTGDSQDYGMLLYCDLDRFHLVNDIHGHDSGNNLLIETARRIETILPDDGTLGRIGADEFVAFIPLSVDELTSLEDDDTAPKHLLKKQARNFSLRILAAFRRPFTIRDQPSYLSTTIGIGLLSEEIDDGQTLLKNAHRALAHAKTLGPANFAFYAGELADEQQRRLSLQSRLHHALEHDEFSLHYQPIIDLSTGQIVGAEALLRWTTGDGEAISPAEFIPVAEDSGLIIPIGDWVLHQACRDLSNWLDDGLELAVSLNLSPLQFFHVDIVEQARAAARDAGISPSQVELELTESAMLVDPDETTQILGRLQDAGFSIAIDDFGTGYSSLERLKQLPVEKLKIDRSFVCDLPGTSRDASIVRSVVTLAKNFDMISLAEGIETREQWHALREMGCPYGQGYLFSRPIPEADFRKLCSTAPNWLVSEATTSS